MLCTYLRIFYSNPKEKYRVGQPDRVEASGMGSERIHQRQSKGDRSLLDTGQGGSGQDSRDSGEGL